MRVLLLTSRVSARVRLRYVINTMRCGLLTFLICMSNELLRFDAA
jgi:hypothetical protein